MKLQPDVAKKYRLVSIRPGKYNFKDFGEIDLRKITLKQADELVTKGFPFLKKRNSVIIAGSPKDVTTKIKEKEIVEKIIKPESDVNILRGNKEYVNKLLTLNWNDLQYNDKLIFFNSEKYFLKKKTLFIENSDIVREMRSLHSKMRALDPDVANNNKRKDIMTRLVALEEEKESNWQIIDDWSEPKELSTEKKPNLTPQQVLEIDKKIKANKIWIYRAEKTITKMPTKTEKEKIKKEKKIKELNERKKEIEQLEKIING